MLQVKFELSSINSTNSPVNTDNVRTLFENGQCADVVRVQNLHGICSKLARAACPYLYQATYIKNPQINTKDPFPQTYLYFTLYFLCQSLALEQVQHCPSGGVAMQDKICPRMMTIAAVVVTRFIVVAVVVVVVASFARHHCCCPPGMVHANVGHEITLLTLS